MANRYMPFGYEIADGEIRIIEREAEAVKNIFSLCALPAKIDTKKLQKTK